MLNAFELLTKEEESPSLHTDAEYALASEIQLAIETGLCQCWMPIKTQCKKVRAAIIAGNKQERKDALYRAHG